METTTTTAADDDDDENIDETFSQRSGTTIPREKLLKMARELRRRGNEMLNSHGKWENDRNKWIWIQNATTTTATAGGITATWASTLPLPQPLPIVPSESDPEEQQEITTTTTFPNATRLAIYGSSYTRELFLDMERVHYNISKRNICDNLGWEANKKCLNAEEWKDLSSTKEYIPIRQNGDCMPYYHQHSLGSRSVCSKSPCNSTVHPAPFGEGVDIDICGPPGFRVMPNNNAIGEIEIENNIEDRSTTFEERHHSATLKGNVAIGFKTFIHTPPGDNLFIERIRSVGLGTVDVAIVEMGYPWGPRGNRNTPNSSLPINMTTAEEIEYYVDFVHDVAFPNTLVIWIATCGCDRKDVMGVEETWDRVKERELGIVLDKRFLCNQKPRAMHTTHGCAGPVLVVLARMVFRLLHFINDEIN